MAEKSVILNVLGMSCHNCEDLIKASVGALEGVRNVNVDMESKKVVVDFNDSKISLEDIKCAITDRGYDME